MDRKAYGRASAGQLRLAVLYGTTAIGVAFVVLEALGLGALCVTSADVAVYTALVVICTGAIWAANALRRGRRMLWPLAVAWIGCLALALRFPVGQSTWLSFTLYVALPLAFCLQPPRGILWSAGALAVYLAIRLGILSPAALNQRAAAPRDIVLCLVLPLAAAGSAQGLAALGVEADRLREALARVTRLNLSYQDYSASVEERSALEERLRLTRDIHDVVGYALTNAIMTMRAASLMCGREPERAPVFLESARADAEQALAQVRGFLGDLRRREIRNAAGPVAMARVVRSFKAATGAEVEIDYGNFRWAIPAEAAMATSHFVQEGMLNAVTHGKAGHIRVAFREDGGQLDVCVRDDGSGASKVQEGIGIAGMRERLDRLGGSLSYESGSTGFAIRMRIPLDSGQDSEAVSGTRGDAKEPRP